MGEPGEAIRIFRLDRADGKVFYGADAEVLAPESVRVELRRRLMAMAGSAEK